MRLLACLTCLCGFVLLSPFTPQVRAETKPVKLINEWKGSVADETKQKTAPECITTAKALGQLWMAWGIAAKVPSVDFAKQIVIVGTAGGSRLNLTARLDDNGNLEVLGMQTLDIAPGFRYVIATVGREGIKTVNKKVLPSE
jgi:hypothetical protein